MSKSLSRVFIGIFVLSLFVVLALNQTCTAKDKVIKIKFGADVPPMAPAVKVWQGWADEVNEKTNGRVKVDTFWGQALVRGGEQRKALIKGIAEVTEFSFNHDRDNFKLNSVVSLPVLGFKDLEAGTRIWYDLIEKFPEMKAEFKGTEILWLNLAFTNIIHTKKKPVNTPDDLKGMKITGDPIILDALGATPVPLPPPDVYMSLDRGLIEGELGAYVAPGIFRYMNLLPYHTEIMINPGQFFVLFSGRTWKKLPADIQETIVSLNEKYRKAERDVFVKDDALFRQKAIEAKQTFIQPSSDVQDLFLKKVRPVHEKWIAEREAKGLPAKAVYNEMNRLIQVYAN